MLYANIIVDISSEELNKGFSYIVPTELEKDICVGSYVKVPFGKGERSIKGYVISLSGECAFDTSKLKSIEEIVTDSETAESRLVALAAWMSRYYSCNFIKALHTVLPVKKKVRKRKSPAAAPVVITEEIKPDTFAKVPTRQQGKAIDEILKEWQGKNRPSLIFGVTGSGKTLIYMELMERVLSEGKQAILLIPEIALTYQMVGRFRERFGDKVAFLNSRLSAGERYEAFKAAKSGDIRVMIGPRSALFAPFLNLGLIIIDEEHEESYRSETAPRYHARETALERARMDGAHVVMGSATPSLDSYTRALAGDYALVRLDHKYASENKAEVTLVDMKAELRDGNRSLISERLRIELKDCLESGHQAMLFLNRRGYAGFVNCKSCGYVVKCPHCDVSLTEHKNGKLVCHYCGYTVPKVSLCPKCGSRAIGGVKCGTEQIEEYIGNTFPEAKTLRMDLDTTSGKEGHRKILSAFKEGRGDILIGTQMIVKGHDYPNVALVGVLMADLSLNESDYRSAERTFQLVSQAVGRTGRGEIPGKAVIQTYEPEHYSIQAAMAQDYEKFYNEEMAFRSFLEYPPCGNMMQILGTSGDEASLLKGMDFIYRFIRKMDKGKKLIMVGPSPLPVKKVSDIYREALYVRNKDRRNLEYVADKVEEYVNLNSGFDNIMIQFDHNV